MSQQLCEACVFFAPAHTCIEKPTWGHCLKLVKAKPGWGAEGCNLSSLGPIIIATISSRARRLPSLRDVIPEEGRGYLGAGPIKSAVEVLGRPRVRSGGRWDRMGGDRALLHFAPRQGHKDVGFPWVCDGGCGMVVVVFDAASKAMVHIHCDGYAQAFGRSEGRSVIVTGPETSSQSPDPFPVRWDM